MLYYEINFEVITIEDCLEMYERKNKITTINDGNVIGFEENS